MSPITDEDSPNATRVRGRLALAILTKGKEPDPRFTLANERTFLAWIRTSLALMGGGIAIEVFADEIFSPPVRLLTATLLLGCAAAVALLAGWRWLQVERAMRHDAPLPLAPFAPFMALAGFFGAVLLLVTLLLDK